MATTERPAALPTPLPGCTVLPPMEQAGGQERAKGKAPKPTRRRAERFGMLNDFADLSLAGLTGAEVKVWLILFRDTKAATGTARTGQADIARRAGLRPRTVRRALTALEGKGMVQVVRRGGLNVGPSVYRVFGVGNLK